MKDPQRLRTSIQNSLIVVLLAALIALPRPLYGSVERTRAVEFARQGESQKAAAAYLAAAQRLPWDHSLWEQAGNAYLQANDDANANELYQLALDHHSLSAAGTMAWGDVALALNDPKAAMERWTKALQMGGDPADLLNRLAQGYQRQGDLQAELQAWQKYVAVQPEDAAAQYRLGLLLAAFSPDQALPHLTEAARLDPSLDEPVQSLRTALNTALLSDEAAYRSMLCGRALAALGSWDLADIAFQKSVQAHPGYAEAWAWLAEAEQQLGQDGTAEIQKAVGLNPDSAMVQGLYGFYLQRQKQPLRALGAFRIAAALEPKDSGWEIAVAHAYELTDDLIQARAHYQHAVELSPNDPSTWQALAEFSLRDQVDLEALGLPAVLRLVELNPEDWQSLDLAGQFLLTLGDYPGAEALLLKAAGIAPDQPDPALHLGLVYLQTGSRQTAYEYFLKASDLDPAGSSGWQARRLLERYFP